MNGAAPLETFIDWIERGRVPDTAVRAGIRRLCRSRRDRVMAGDCEARLVRQQAFIRAMDAGPIAPVPEKANEQHYELPAAFFTHVLGPRLKYSGCLFADPAVAAPAADQLVVAEPSACETER